MVKMVRSARGEYIDWDLLRITAAQHNRVAPAVEIVNRVEKRGQRARLEAARKLLAQTNMLEAAKLTNIEASQPVPTKLKNAIVALLSESDDNGWTD